MGHATPLLLLFMVLPGHAFPAFDCTSTNLTYTTYDLREPEGCASVSQDYKSPLDIRVQIIQEDDISDHHGIVCKITLTRKITRCGFTSLTYGEVWPEFERSYDITPEECRLLRKKGQITLFGHLINAPPGETSTHTIYTAGRFKTDGSCEVSEFWRDGVQYSKSVETTFISIFYSEVPATVSASKNLIVFKSGLRAVYTDLSTRDATSGLHLWDRLTGSCSDKLSEVYTGPGKIYYPMGVSGLQPILTIESEDTHQYGGFLLGSRSTVCRLEAHSTQVENIHVLLLREHDQPLELRSPRGESMTIRDDMKAQLGYLFMRDRIQIGKGFSMIAESLCEMNRDILMTKLHLPLLSGNQVLAMDLWGRGTHMKVAGSAIYVTKCPQVDVTRREHANCTHEIPVFHRGEEWFVDPVTFILTRYGQVVPCDPMYPIKWGIGNDWYCSYPAFSVCGAPEKMTPRSYSDGFYHAEFRGLAGGLYSQEDWRRHEMAMMYRDNRESLVSKASASTLEHDLKTGQQPSILTIADMGRIAEHVGSQVVPFFHIVGYGYTVMIGFIAILQGACYIINCTIRMFRLYRIYGCSVRLFAAFWSMAYHVISMPIEAILRSVRPPPESMEAGRRSRSERYEVVPRKRLGGDRPPLIA